VVALLAALGVAIASGLGGSDDGKRQLGTVAGKQQPRGDRGQERLQQAAASPAPEQPQPAEPTPPQTGGTETPDTASGAELNNQGYSLIQQGRYDEAIPVLQRAVSSLEGSGGLTYAYALFNLGQALRLAGSPEEAIPYLEQRLQIPNQTDVVQQELDLARAEAGLTDTKPGNGPKPG
jgi:eukaryotic-like serine/threonine-protein kinase